MPSATNQKKAFLKRIIFSNQEPEGSKSLTFMIWASSEFLLNPYEPKGLRVHPPVDPSYHCILYGCLWL